ncbi:MAG: hypothetical protein EAZ99_09150 [Alphaproteobacteria bacterium]|nr:MAG: hypothetical protein EAZ99_09150 [Alphaproteobacteria bacterium]
MFDSALARGGPSRSRLDLTPLFQRVFAHWQLIVISFCTVAGLGLWAAMQAPTTFTSSARLLVLIGSEYALRPELGIAAGDYVFSRSQIVKAEQDILASRQLHREVVARLGVERLYPEFVRDPEGEERAAVQFGRDISANTPEQTSLLRVSYRHANAETAAEALRVLIELYLERRAVVFARPQAPTLALQRDRMEQRLSEAQDRLAQLQLQTGIIDPVEQRDLLVRRLAGLEAVDARLREQVAQTTAQLGRLITGQSSLPRVQELGRDQTAGPEFDNRTNTLVQLELRRAELQARFLRPTQQAQDLERQIGELERVLAASPLRREQAVRRGRTNANDEMERQVALTRVDLPGLIARRDEVGRQMEATRAAIATLVTQSSLLDEALREVKLLTEQYTQARRRFAEAEVAEELQRRSRTTVRVIQPAEVPTRGASLKRPIALVALVGAAMTSVFLLALSGVFRQTLLDERDVERRLRLPVLAAVTDRQRRYGWVRRWAGHLTVRRVLTVLVLVVALLLASAVPLRTEALWRIAGGAVQWVAAWVAKVLPSASDQTSRPLDLAPAPAQTIAPADFPRSSEGPPRPPAPPAELPDALTVVAIPLGTGVAPVLPDGPPVARRRAAPEEGVPPPAVPASAAPTAPPPAGDPASQPRSPSTEPVWQEPATSDRWAVQVGTFRGEAAAEALAARLATTGHRMQRQRVVDGSGQPWFLVRVLAGPDRSGAVLLSQRLREQDSLPATVIELPQRRTP